MEESEKVEVGKTRKDVVSDLHFRNVTKTISQDRNNLQP